MSYRLQTDEPLSEGVRRVAKEQIDDALAHLTASGDAIDEAIHEARKDFKKVRGLLRLVRDEIGEEQYQRENRCFRDAGRLLSDLRDSAIQVATLDNLIDTYSDLLADDLFPAARQTLVNSHKEEKQRVREEETLTDVVQTITQARIRVDAWPVDNETYTAVAPGLKRVYKRGVKRMADSQAEPAPPHLHEWRKRVKYLWYHMRLLRPMWPEPLDALADEIHDLSDYLGDDHDLAILKKEVETRPLLPDTPARDTLFTLIDRQRQPLQNQAMALGARIYAEKPKRFVKRLGQYWDAWTIYGARP